MLVATLIGFFITSGEILVGADTVISNESGLVLVRPKYCQTGPGSVATLQGQYYFEHAATQSVSAFYNLFRETCHAIAVAKRPSSVVEQADSLAEKLRADLAHYLSRVPTHEFERLYPDSVVVARLSVAGYDDDRPVVAVRGIGVAGSTSTRWDARVAVLQRLTFDTCGVRFQGEEAVVDALRAQDTRLSEIQDSHRELAALRGSDGDCSKWDLLLARRLFLLAVQQTVKFGSDFGIRKGSVGGDVDFVRIPRRGTITAERVPQ